MLVAVGARADEGRGHRRRRHRPAAGRARSVGRGAAPAGVRGLRDWQDVVAARARHRPDVAVHRRRGGLRGLRHPPHAARRRAGGLSGRVRRHGSDGDRDGGARREIAQTHPPDDVTAAQLRASSGGRARRSWWSPTTSTCSPPAVRARWHRSWSSCRRPVIWASTCSWPSLGRGGRAMFEPLPQRMREAGATGLLLSGDRQEGRCSPEPTSWPAAARPRHLVRRGRKPLLMQAGLPAGSLNPRPQTRSAGQAVRRRQAAGGRRPPIAARG